MELKGYQLEPVPMLLIPSGTGKSIVKIPTSDCNTLPLLASERWGGGRGIDSGNQSLQWPPVVNTVVERMQLGYGGQDYSYDSQF